MTEICRDATTTGDLVVVQKSFTMLIPDDVKFQRAIIGALSLMHDERFWSGQGGTASIEQSIQLAIEMINTIEVT